MNKLASLALGLTMLLPLTGCYKAEMEAQKARADGLDTKVKELEAAKAAAEQRAQTAQASVNQVNGFRNGTAQLATVVNGTIVGVDTIRLVDGPQGPQFVKHGTRKRGTWSIVYSNGQLADQPFTMNRDSGTKYVEGNIKGGKADGEWIWYSKDGKAANRETFKDGKLQSVESASTAKDGKVSWKKMDKASSDKFWNDRLAVFAGIPELSREK